MQKLLSRIASDVTFGYYADEQDSHDGTSQVITIFTFFVAQCFAVGLSLKGSIPVQEIRGRDVVVQNYPQGEDVNRTPIYFSMLMGVASLGFLSGLVAPRGEKRISQYNAVTIHYVRWTAVWIALLGVFFVCTAFAGDLPKQKIRITGHQASQYKFKADDETGRLVVFNIKVVDPGKSESGEIDFFVTLSEEIRKHWFITVVDAFRGTEIIHNRKQNKAAMDTYDPDELMKMKRVNFYLLDDEMKKGNSYAIVVYIHPRIICGSVDPNAEIATLDELLENPEGNPVSISLAP